MVIHHYLYYFNKVYGFDISPEMLEVAENKKKIIIIIERKF